MKTSTQTSSAPSASSASSASPKKMWLVIGWCVDQHRVVGPFESVSPPTSDQVESLLPSYEWNHAVAFEVSGVVIRDPRKADEVVSRSREAFADALA